jgi:membrane fusion protein, copper/silver efflux system
MLVKTSSLLLLLLFIVVSVVRGQGVREHTRPARTDRTTVSESQAVDLTLTLNPAAVRAVQTVVRTGGTIDRTGKIVFAYVDPPDAALMKVGQRVRVFPVESRFSMYQARLTKVVPDGDRARVEATLASSGRENSINYLVEITTERGELLSVANEAIIEEGDRRIVYVQQNPGQYLPQQIETGVQGDLYTQVLQGLNEGDQVVTFGSFFIDAEHKLKNADPAR